MSDAELVKYVKGVFETELSIYVQEQTLSEMRRTRDSLATGVKVKAPMRRANSVSIFDHIWLFGQIFGVILGAIGAISVLFDSGNIIARILLAIFGFIVFGIIGIVIGIVVGIVVGAIRKIIDQIQVRKKYRLDFEKYQHDLSRDRLRNDIELKKKSVLAQDVKKMEEQIAAARQNLKKIYSYGVIASPYRNISAIGTIYGYLVSGRTYSLAFNPKTGDRGAYNIFEEERRLDQIITNTEEILYSLDSIAQTQRELAAGLKNANSQINSLKKEFTKFAVTTADNVEEIKTIEAVNAYNLDCIRRQNALIGWLALVG